MNNCFKKITYETKNVSENAQFQQWIQIIDIFLINLEQVQTQTNGLPFLMNYYQKQKIKKDK